MAPIVIICLLDLSTACSLLIDYVVPSNIRPRSSGTTITQETPPWHPCYALTVAVAVVVVVTPASVTVTVTVEITPLPPVVAAALLESWLGPTGTMVIPASAALDTADGTFETSVEAVDCALPHGTPPFPPWL